jgi:HNH endonuclease
MPWKRAAESGKSAGGGPASQPLVIRGSARKRLRAQETKPRLCGQVLRHPKLTIGQRHLLRAALLKRDGRCCALCARRMSKASMTIDHIIARRAGGANVLPNLRLCCKACNVGRHDDPRGDHFTEFSLDSPVPVLEIVENSARTTKTNSLGHSSAASGTAVAASGDVDMPCEDGDPVIVCDEEDRDVIEGDLISCGDDSAGLYFGARSDSRKVANVVLVESSDDEAVCLSE